MDSFCFFYVADMFNYDQRPLNTEVQKTNVF